MYVDGVYSAVVRHGHVVETEFVVGSVEVMTWKSNGVSLSMKTFLDDVLLGGVFVADSVNPKSILSASAGRKMICYVDSYSSKGTVRFHERVVYQLYD